MTARTDDPERDFTRNEAEREEWLKMRPICSLCNEPIQEEYALNIFGEWICDGCAKDYTVPIPELEYE